jgi:hypothetical protein
MEIKDIVEIMEIAALGDADFEDVDSAAARRALQQRHLRMSRRLEEFAIRGMEEMQQKVARGEPLNMSAPDAKALLDLSRKLAPSLAVGEEMLALLDSVSGARKPKPN